MFKMKQIIFALCAVMMVNAVFAAASDPSGLTLVDLTSPDREVTSSRAFDGANDTPPSSAFNDTEGKRFLINGIGGDCVELPDGFIIRGKKKLTGGNVDSYLDHRIAMTAAVGLIASEKGGNIQSPECCAISFPDFFKKLGV